MPWQKPSAAFQSPKRGIPASYVVVLGRCIKLFFTARGVDFFHPQTFYDLTKTHSEKLWCCPLSLVKLPKIALLFSDVSSARNASEGIVITKLDQKPRYLPKNMPLHNDGVCELNSSSFKNHQNRSMRQVRRSISRAMVLLWTTWVIFIYSLVRGMCSKHELSLRLSDIRANEILEYTISWFCVLLSLPPHNLTIHYFYQNCMCQKAMARWNWGYQKPRLNSHDCGGYARRKPRKEWAMCEKIFPLLSSKSPSQENDGCGTGGSIKLSSSWLLAPLLHIIWVSAFKNTEHFCTWECSCEERIKTSISRMMSAVVWPFKNSTRGFDVCSPRAHWFLPHYPKPKIKRGWLRVPAKLLASSFHFPKSCSLITWTSFPGAQQKGLQTVRMCPLLFRAGSKYINL